MGLSWLRDNGPSLPTLDDARAHLETLPPGSLVDLLIDHAHDDEALARKLLLMATRPASGASANMMSLRVLIDQAFAYHGFVSYREVCGYVRGIEQMIDVLEGLLEEGRGGEVVELAEYAIAAAERALEHVDDSDGQMREVIERLEALHLDACRRAAPDPVALAERLFTRELDGEWDAFYQAVVRYADVLGNAGLDRYREPTSAGQACLPWHRETSLEGSTAPASGSRGSWSPSRIWRWRERQRARAVLGPRRGGTQDEPLREAKPKDMLMTDGKADENKGRLKEAAGALTDDQSLKNEGKVDKASGKTKGAVGRAADKAKKALRKD